jgi:xanthine dehydrogenase accessory factor
VTRDHAIDQQLLEQLIAHPHLGYLGMIGSRGKIARFKKRLEAKGMLDDATWARLRAPIGLDLGAETPEEIALSILAELVQVRRGRADFVASPGPATLSGEADTAAQPLQPVVDDIVLVDPVCGMTVDRATARHLAEHDGTVYAFCSIGCRTRFSREPAVYLAAPGTHSMEEA